VRDRLGCVKVVRGHELVNRCEAPLERKSGVLRGRRTVLRRRSHVLRWSRGVHPPSRGVLARMHASASRQ
jgi:hypothetical protein